MYNVVCFRLNPLRLLTVVVGEPWVELQQQTRDRLQVRLRPPVLVEEPGPLILG